MWQYWDRNQLGRHSRCCGVPPGYLLLDQGVISPSYWSIVCWKLMVETLLRNCPWPNEAALPKATCFPHGQPISKAWTVSGYKAQHPCSNLGVSLKGHLSFRPSYRIIWDSCCNPITVPLSLCPLFLPLQALLFRYFTTEPSPCNLLSQSPYPGKLDLRLTCISYDLHSTILPQGSYKKRSIQRWIPRWISVPGSFVHGSPFFLERLSKALVTDSHSKFAQKKVSKPCSLRPGA